MAIDLQQCRENFRRRALERLAAREQLRQMAREAAIAAITLVIPDYPQVSLLYLFGSVTQPGQFQAHSDIDISVAGTDAVTYFALWRDLETACPGWPIDLREINQPSHFTNTVCQQGELIYAGPSRTA